MHGLVCCPLVGREPFGAHVLRLPPWRQRHTTFLERGFDGIRHQIDDLLEAIFSSYKDRGQSLHKSVVLFCRTCDFELHSETRIDQQSRLAALAADRGRLEQDDIDVFVVSSRKSSCVIPSRFANGSIVSSGPKMLHDRPPRRRGGAVPCWSSFVVVDCWCSSLLVRRRLLCCCIQRFGDFGEQDSFSHAGACRQTLRQIRSKRRITRDRPSGKAIAYKIIKKSSCAQFVVTKKATTTAQRRVASKLPVGFQKALHRS